VKAFRRKLAWIACGWLCCQLSLLAAAPGSLFAHAPQAADSVTCTCVHTGNAACPMHRPAKKQSGCECRNTTDPDAANIVSLIGPIAVMAVSPAHMEPRSITRLPNSTITRFVSFVAPPDGPPPRA
jgi:hypothetical protein